MTHLNRQDGFVTLYEAVIGILVFGVLAAMAFPRFTMHLENARAAEAVQIVESLYKAQRAHYAENKAYANNFAVLEINLRPMSSFNSPVLSTVDPIISVTRSNNSYTITMTGAGIMGCTPAGGTCSHLGF